MTLRAIILALILMQSEVELCAVLDYRFVERGKQHVVFVVNLGYGYDQESVIFSDIAPYEGRRTIRTRPVCNQQFLEKGILKVGHLRLVKS